MLMTPVDDRLCSNTQESETTHLVLTRSICSGSACPSPQIPDSLRSSGLRKKTALAAPIL